MNIELDFLSFDDKYNEYESLFERLSNAVFSYLNLDFNAYISLSIVNLETIHSLNRDYRNIDRPTDVISFAYLDDVEDKETLFKSGKQVILGDIYISIEKAIAQAEEYKHSLLRELSFLFVHGLLHLLGYDHMEKEDEIIMFDLQNKILEKEGISRWKKSYS